MKKNHIKLAWIAVLPFIATACKDKQVITPPESNTIQGQFVTSADNSLVNIIDASIKKYTIICE